jgi:indole-3-pyruvate monooxygenase
MQDGEGLLNESGMPKREFPNHWKGENGLYCVGLSMKGLAGVSCDAKTVAADIKSVVDSMGPF